MPSNIRALLKNESFWLLLFSSLLALTRFLNLGAAPFVADEPTFQLMLDEHFKNGTLPMHALIGSKGVPYGPTVLWTYGLIRLFTDHVQVILFFDVLLSVSALFLVYVALKKATTQKQAAWTTALLSCSPYLFFYSRIAWDVTLLVFFTALIFYCLASLEKGVSLAIWALLGLACALALNTHLMMLPILFATAVCLLSLTKNSEQPRQYLKGLGIALAVFLVVSIPYFSVLLKTNFAAPTAPLYATSFLEQLFGVTEGLFRYLSPQGMDYFLTAPMPSYVFLGFISKALALVAVVWFLVRRIKLPSPQSIVFLFSILSFFLLILYLHILKIAFVHPHYFLPAWWVGALFLANFLTTVPKPFSLALKGTVGLLIAMNAFFTAQTFSSIYKNGGTRGIYYGSSLRQTQEALESICTQMQTRHLQTAAADFSNITGVLEPSVAYLREHLKACRGLQVHFKTAQNLYSGIPSFTVQYAESSGLNAKLSVLNPN